MCTPHLLGWAERFDLKFSKTAKLKSKKYCLISFECCYKGDHCLFDKNQYEFTTFYPSTWIHIIFLSIQVNLKFSFTFTRFLPFSIENGKIQKNLMIHPKSLMCGEFKNKIIFDSYPSCFFAIFN